MQKEDTLCLYSTEFRLLRLDTIYASKMYVITIAYQDTFTSFSNMQEVLWDDVVRNQVTSLKPLLLHV